MSCNVQPDKKAGRGRNRLFAAAAFFLLFSGLVWVYRDSFQQGPKRDQIYYLIETCRSQSFGEILGKSWSNNRTRTVHPGDSLLFRPGLFVLLAVQSYLFDYHQEYYRWVSLLIHAAVAVLLFRLLYSISLSFRDRLSLGESRLVALPLAFTLLFAFSAAIYDTVSWEHIQGYMVFAGLVLFSLDRFLKFERNGCAQPGSLWGAWLSLCAAAFLHEAGVGFALIFGLFVSLAGRWRGKWPWKRCTMVLACFAAIPLIYLTFSYVDYRSHADQVIAEDFSNDLVSGTSWLGTILNYLRFVVFCCVQPLAPFLLKTENRTTVSIQDFFFSEPGVIGSPLLHQVALICLLLFILALVGNLVFRSVRRRELFPMLVLALLGAFVSLYVLLRLNVRTQLAYSFLGLNSQYVYICLPLAISLLLPAILEFVSLPSKVGRRRWFIWVIVYAMVGAAIGANQTLNCNRMAALAFAEVRDKFLLPGSKALAELKASGLKGVQFVFEDPEDFVAYSDYGVPITTILFGRHEVAENPDAIISLPSGRILPPDGRAFPYYEETLPFDVVSVRQDGRTIKFHSSYAIYRYGGKWIGILYSYPFATLDRIASHPFTVVASDRKEIVARSAEAGRDD